MSEIYQQRYTVWNIGNKLDATRNQRLLKAGGFPCGSLMTVGIVAACFGAFAALCNMPPICTFIPRLHRSGFCKISKLTKGLNELYHDHDGPCRCLHSFTPSYASDPQNSCQQRLCHAISACEQYLSKMLLGHKDSHSRIIHSCVDEARGSGESQCCVACSRIHQARHFACLCAA